MIYTVAGKAWLKYRIGDRVEVIGGVCGKVVKRYKPNQHTTVQVDILTDYGDIIMCPEHHIRKCTINHIPWRSE